MHNTQNTGTVNLVDLAMEKGLEPRYMASTQGGEYACICPNCTEGHDRFRIWPKQGKCGRYWCRRCGVTGDAMQFCRDYLLLSYSEACHKLNIPKNEPRSNSPFKPQQLHVKAELPGITWQKKAFQFVDWCHQKLLSNECVMDQLKHRGINEQSIHRFKLGFCPQDYRRDRTSWGLSSIINRSGIPSKIWLPKGIVIPALSSSNIVVKIKIRRDDWQAEGNLPKYVEISGSMKAPTIIGNLKTLPVIVVESEFDAMLIHQEASDICSCMALGGAQKRPDLDTHLLLKACPQILFSLDFDDAGKKEYARWRRDYGNLQPWPTPLGKSPGDAHALHGINLRQWIEVGLQYMRRID